MTISMRRAAFLLSGTIAAGMYGSVSLAADVETNVSLPAVSGPNGKIEFDGGWSDIDDLSSDETFRGGAAFSFPVGDMFGIQADLTVTDVFGDTTVGGAGHFFTRDPNSYLLGVYGGYVDAGPANVWHIGPEAELYLGNVSIEAVGGYMDISNGGGSEFYAVGNLALYATDNLRLSVGASSVANFESANIGLEWFMDDTGIPASLTLEGRLGEDGYSSVLAGFSVYFGGEDKSLIRRHREDDPRLQFFNVFNTGVLSPGGPLGGDPEECPNGEWMYGYFYCEGFPD